MRAAMATLFLLLPAHAVAQESEKPRAPHPEPRVIVSVLSVRGPHERPKLERAARLGWGKIVGCYHRHGERKRGQAVIEITVSGAGKVVDTAKKSSSFEPELTTCLRVALRRLEMPGASARSSALVEIQLAPGDPS